MRILYLIVIHGLRNPRFYIEAHFQKMKLIIKLALIPILFITLSNIIATYPSINNIQVQVYESLQYIPEFTYQEDKLKLESGEKPLYYGSDDFQLIIDPEIRSVPIFNTIPISKERYRKIDPDKMITVLVLRDQALFKISTFEKEIKDPAINISSDTHLQNLLLTITTNPFYTLLPLILVSFLFAATYYWLVIIICAMVVGFVNQFLNQNLTLKQRIKIIVPLTFVPIILSEVIQWIIPGFSLPIFPFTIFVLIIYYMAFKSYTSFVNGLMTNFTADELQDFIDIPENRKKQKREQEIIIEQQNLKSEYLDITEQLKELNPEENQKKVLKFQDRLQEIKYRIIELEYELRTLQNTIKDIEEEIFKKILDQEKNNKNK